MTLDDLESILKNSEGLTDKLAEGTIKSEIADLFVSQPLEAGQLFKANSATAAVILSQINEVLIEKMSDLAVFNQVLHNFPEIEAKDIFVKLGILKISALITITTFPLLTEHLPYAHKANLYKQFKTGFLDEIKNAADAGCIIKHLNEDDARDFLKTLSEKTLKANTVYSDIPSFVASFKMLSTEKRMLLVSYAKTHLCMASLIDLPVLLQVLTAEELTLLGKDFITQLKNTIKTFTDLKNVLTSCSEPAKALLSRTLGVKIVDFVTDNERFCLLMQSFPDKAAQLYEKFEKTPSVFIKNYGDFSRLVYALPDSLKTHEAVKKFEDNLADLIMDGKEFIQCMKEYPNRAKLVVDKLAGEGRLPSLSFEEYVVLIDSIPHLIKTLHEWYGKPPTRDLIMKFDNPEFWLLTKIQDQGAAKYLLELMKLERIDTESFSILYQKWNAMPGFWEKIKPSIKDWFDSSDLLELIRILRKDEEKREIFLGVSSMIDLDVHRWSSFFEMLPQDQWALLAKIITKSSCFEQTMRFWVILNKEKPEFPQYLNAIYKAIDRTKISSSLLLSIFSILSSDAAWGNLFIHLDEKVQKDWADHLTIVHYHNLFQACQAQRSYAPLNLLFQEIMPVLLNGPAAFQDNYFPRLLQLSITHREQFLRALDVSTWSSVQKKMAADSLSSLLVKDMRWENRLFLMKLHARILPQMLPIFREDITTEQASIAYRECMPLLSHEQINLQSFIDYATQNTPAMNLGLIESNTGHQFFQKIIRNVTRDLPKLWNVLNEKQHPDNALPWKITHQFVNGLMDRLMSYGLSVKDKSALDTAATAYFTTRTPEALGILVHTTKTIRQDARYHLPLFNLLGKILLAIFTLGVLPLASIVNSKIQTGVCKCRFFEHEGARELEQIEEASKLNHSQTGQFAPTIKLF